MSVDPLQLDIIRRILEKRAMHGENNPPSRAWTYSSMSGNLEGEYESTDSGDVGGQAMVSNVVDDSVMSIGASIDKDISSTDIVLYDQSNHISKLIWKGEKRRVLQSNEHSRTSTEWKLSKEQKWLVEIAGFKYLYLIVHFQMDWCLLTALVDRWRNETNTFHMPRFEMTITLEDVAYILGLRVIRKAVTGKIYKETEDILGMVLGQHPSDPTNTKALRSGCVKLTWLRNQFSQLQSNASKIDVIRATWAYLLHLLGTTIFANTSGNMVSVSYLPLLADFVECVEYAWGAATLAFLYRALMRASRKNTANIGGSMTLFTVWAYEHLGVGRPDVVRLCRPFPRAVRWKCRRRTDNIHNCYRPYRQELDQLKECEVSKI
ncbi:protein MAIN-LIKE 2-like [Macadamia integrifolia]|uniref:protein MAIN-LIKE 2-like n=1 Tax=Macadamia integrifolia TaxID=60698 RepID=UPI001C4F5F4E|nr:protein MAIN-LIKE 2-like [Macadamia integrifolia]